jgi:farnesol dehydrogenase
MRILITGVTGFLGGRLAQAFAGQGMQVRGLVRAGSNWNDKPAGAEAVTGDVTDTGSLHRAAERCDAIVHAAALVKMWVRNRTEFDQVNVQGLGNVISAARKSGAKLLYTSSFIALGPTDGELFEEDTPRRQDMFYTDYERTKWLADQLARTTPADDLELIRLYPGVVYGPGSMTQGNLIVQLLLQHARGKLPGILGPGNLRQCFAYIDDVVDGFVAALEKGEPGSGYILGGENRTVLELFDCFEEFSGIPAPKRKIPFGVAALIGKAQRWRAHLTGTEPELTDEVVGVYRHEWAYSSEKACAELGYRITPLREGIRNTVEWLREIGELQEVP